MNYSVIFWLARIYWEAKNVSGEKVVQITICCFFSYCMWKNANLHEKFFWLHLLGKGEEDGFKVENVEFFS